MDIRTAKKILKNKNINNVEVTKYKGEYWILHICKNNNPVPLYHDKNIVEIITYLTFHY